MKSRQRSGRGISSQLSGSTTAKKIAKVTVGNSNGVCGELYRPARSDPA